MVAPIQKGNGAPSRGVALERLRLSPIGGAFLDLAGPALTARIPEPPPSWSIRVCRTCNRRPRSGWNGWISPMCHSSENSVQCQTLSFCSFLALVLRKELEERLAGAGLKPEWRELLADLDRLQEIEASRMASA